jgi:hypothetical protein
MSESMELAGKIGIILMNTNRDTAFAAMNIAITILTEQQAKEVSSQPVESLS